MDLDDFCKEVQRNARSMVKTGIFFRKVVDTINANPEITNSVVGFQRNFAPMKVTDLYESMLIQIRGYITICGMSDLELAEDIIREEQTLERMKL